MIYHRVDIKYKQVLNRYEVRFSVLDGDRVTKPKPKPNPLGFYYYTDTMSKAAAFNELKTLMVNNLKNRMTQLQHNLDTLEALNLPDEAD